VCVWH